MGALDYLQQLANRAPAPSVMDYQVAGLQAAYQGFLQGQDDKRKREAEAAAAKRQAEQDEIARTERALKAGQTAKRQAEQDEIARTERALKAGQTAMAAGRNETAAGILNQLQSSGALQRYAGISGDKIMGATVTDPQAVAQRDFAMGMMGNPLMAAFANPDALTAPTTRQDFSGDATTNALAGVFGRPPIKTAPGGHTIINPDGTLGETAPLIARPLDPLTAELRQAQTQRALRPPAGRSGGGGGGGRSSGARSGGGGKAAPAGKPMKQSDINAVLSTVDKLRTAIERRHTTGSGQDRTVNRGAFEREFYPKAEQILRSKGLDPKLYLPDFDRTPGVGRVYGPPDPGSAPAQPASRQTPQSSPFQGVPQGSWGQTSLEILRDVGLA